MGIATAARQNGTLNGASINRLACLVRHWIWANEAMERFERELARGWVYDDDPPADHLFGAYYHWCALLSEAQLDTLRPDLEACLPDLREYRRLLVVIPSSREEHPRPVDLLRDDETLGRLRRVHRAFGDALREEQMARELELVDLQDR